MDDFIPPPMFTTIRFSHEISAMDAIDTMRKYVEDDMNYRGISTPDISVESHPIIEDLLLLKVIKSTSIPKHEKQVIVDKLCGLAVLRGAHIFVPGIIAVPASLKKGDGVSVYVDLDKSCLKGSHNFDGNKFFVGNGLMEVSRQDVFSSDPCTSGIGVLMTEPLYLSPCLDFSMLPCNFFPQNLPSVVVGHVLNPPKYCVVLDMCAAPGGKTTHLSSLMRNTGKVIALDRSSAKVQKIKDNARRLNCGHCIFAYCADSRNIISEDALPISCRTNGFSPPYLPESFSHILLDAPCSALGQRPKFPNNISKSKNTVSSYPSFQWRLVECAIKLLEMGGTLVYSTCTTTYEENEGLVQSVLKRYPCVQLAKQTPHLGGYGRDHAGVLDIASLEKLQYFSQVPTDLNKENSKHSSDYDTIGFFIAKFIKIKR